MKTARAAGGAEARESHRGRGRGRLFPPAGWAARLVVARAGDVGQASAGGCHLLGGERAEGEDDGDRGLREGGGFKVLKVAPFEGGKDDYPGPVLVFVFQE